MSTEHELQIPTSSTAPEHRAMTAPPFEATQPEPKPEPEQAPAPSEPALREEATIQFIGGAANLRVTVDPGLTERYAAHFEGPQPEISEFGQEITFRYHGGPLLWGRTAADIRVRPDLAWSFRVRGGVSNADLDLRQTSVQAIEITGGVSRLDLLLPQAAGTVPVRVSGGVSRCDVRRPQQTPVRVEIRGGASRLTVDTQTLGGVGGRTQLESSGYAGSSSSYQIEVGGGASRLSVVPF